MTKEEKQNAEEFIQKIDAEMKIYQNEYNRFTTAAKEMNDKWQQAAAARLAAETMLTQMQKLSEPKETKIQKDFSKNKGKKNE